jgi:hypothetical protein
LMTEENHVKRPHIVGSFAEMTRAMTGIPWLQSDGSKLNPLKFSVKIC